MLNDDRTTEQILQQSTERFAIIGRRIFELPIGAIVLREHSGWLVADGFGAFKNESLLVAIELFNISRW